MFSSSSSALPSSVTFAHQICEDAGVNRAGSGSHHQSVKRSKSHGVSMLCPPRIAAREQPLPRWQVTSFSVGKIFAEQLSGSSRAVLVIDSVEAVFADSLLHPFVRTGINCGRSGQSAVKSGVKNRDLRHGA